MSVNEEQQAELLERYCRELEANPSTTPPTALDPELAAEAKLLRGRLDAPLPSAAFRAQLKGQLEAALRNPKGANPIMPAALQPEVEVPTPVRANRNWFSPRLATAFVVVLILVGGVLLFAGLSKNNASLSADEIIKRAQAVFTDGSIKSMVMTETIIIDVPSMGIAGLPATVPTPTRGPQVATASIQLRLWYEAPNRWRTENVSGGYPAGQSTSQATEVSDGTTVWDYQSYIGKKVTDKHVYVDTADNPAFPTGLLRPVERVASDRYEILQYMKQCYSPTLLGSDMVGDRTAYEIDTGESRCKSSPRLPGSAVVTTTEPNSTYLSQTSAITMARQLGNRYTLWIDQSTYFILSYQIQDSSSTDQNNGTILYSYQFNGPIEPSVFTFTPPADATITDYRPKGAATSSQFDAQMRDIASKAGYPLFVPSYLPSGLIPRQSNTVGGSDSYSSIYLVLEYLPASEVNQSTDARVHGLRIDEMRLTDFSMPVAGWQQIYIDGRHAQVGPDSYGSDKQPTLDLWLTIDGTNIFITGSTLTQDELIKVAHSLVRVPTGSTPKPAPTASNDTYLTPKLASLRQKLGFSIYVPNSAAAKLAVELPIATNTDDPQKATVEIVYHNPDDSFALSVLSGSAGCCRDADKAQQGESVSLADGTTAHFLNNAPEQGGPTLWLPKVNTYVEIRGWQMSKDALVALANTLSSTADPYGK